MATIIIKDLPENLDLDRKAMQAITGGSRLASRAGVRTASQVRAGGAGLVNPARIVDFRTWTAPGAAPGKPIS